MITTIIFDMDGLMIDTERVYFKSYQKVLKEYGKEIDESFFIPMLGKPASHDVLYLRKMFGEMFPAEEVFQKQLDEAVRVFKEEEIPLKLGVMELLEYGKEKGYKMVIASSSKRDVVLDITKKVGFAPYLDGYVCGDEVEHGKPHPEIFLTAAKKMGSACEECIVLEDSEAGIKAAYDAGIRCICIPDMKHPEKAYEELAYRMMTSLHDVRKYLQESVEAL